MEVIILLILITLIMNEHFNLRNAQFQTNESVFVHVINNVRCQTGTALEISYTSTH